MVLRDLTERTAVMIRYMTTLLRVATLYIFLEPPKHEEGANRYQIQAPQVRRTARQAGVMVAGVEQIGGL